MHENGQTILMCTTQTILVFSMEGNDLQHIDPPQFSYLRELRSVSSTRVT